VIGAGGLGQFGEESREVRMRLPEWDRIVYLYSDFGAIDTMPELRQRKLRNLGANEAGHRKRTGERRLQGHDFSRLLEVVQADLARLAQSVIQLTDFDHSQ